MRKMLKWAHNPALRPSYQPKAFESEQNPEKRSQHSLRSEKHGNGRRVEQLPKEAEKLSRPGRRRSLGSLLAKEPIMTKKGQTGFPVRSLVPRKPSPGTEGGRAPIATPDALDRNLKTMSLTRTSDGFGREASLLRESPLKRWSKERVGMLNKDMLEVHLDLASL